MFTTVTNIQQATENTGEFRAGATDLQARYRLGIRSDSITDINQLKDLKSIEWQSNGAAKVGALVKLTDIAKDEGLRNAYPAFVQAAAGLATPQIRAMATMGGALLQHTRCWYYRNPDLNCYKKGGDHCPARTGNHLYGVCFDLGPCVFPHPSTLGMALMAYEAEVEIAGKGRRAVADLYGDGSNPNKDHLLEPSELLTYIYMSEPIPGEQAAYFRTISRFEAEWPLVEVVVRLKIAEDSIAFARVALGGVANIPLNLPHVNQFLEGQPATEDTFKAAANKATENTNPLPMTAYKVKLIYGAVLEALERARGAHE